MTLAHSKITLLTVLLVVMGSVSTLKADCCDPCPVCWDGLYVSGQVGGGWNDADGKFTNANYFNTLGPTVLGSDFSFCSSGFVGGGAIGYNFQICDWVLGVEGGALYTDFCQSKLSPFFPLSDVFHYNVEWTANAKGRLGYACGCFLFFATGGWAGSQVKLSFNDVVSQVFASSKKWANGWTVGGGADYRIFCHFSLGIEYDYNHVKYTHEKTSCGACGTGVGFGTPTINNSLSTHLLFARINFHL